MRFLVDENTGVAVARWLLEKGHEVFSVYEQARGIDEMMTAADSPLVLYLDDVDALFPYPEVYEDFFGLLRSWYEKARSRPNWKKLRLAIAHSTDVYIRLNINRSPFNVGLAIELPELTREQVQELALFLN